MEEKISHYSGEEVVLHTRHEGVKLGRSGSITVVGYLIQLSL